MTTIETKILSQFKQKVAAKLPLYKMILFGSRARGDAAPDSDMDVIVILDAIVDPMARDLIFDFSWEAGFEAGLVIAPVTFSREQWEQGPERYSLLAQAVQSEGVTL